MQRTQFLLSVMLFVVAVLSASVSPAAEDATSLLRYIPSTSNTLAVVRVRELLDSPRAKREGWHGDQLKFLAGADTIPTWVDALVVGGHYVPGVAERWSASVLYCPAGVSVESLAKSENRSLQQFSGLMAMHTNRNGYFLQLKPDVLGVLTPALRQEASRWARFASTNKSPELSDFLSRAAQSQSHIVLAIDMQDMLDPQLIRKRLEATSLLKGKPELVAALDKLFSGLKGVAFFATIGDETNARIDMIFSENLPDQGERFKALLLEMVADEQLVLDDFARGKASVRGAVLSIDVTLSDANLRRMLTLIQAPFPVSPSVSGAVASDASGRPLRATTPPPAQDAPAKDREEYLRKNKQYYVGVERSLRDLQDQKSWATNYSDVAGWFENYAQKIDNLPQAGIDQELIDYAADVASKLRMLASTTRGMVVEIQAAQSKLTYRTDVTAMPYYGGWGGWGWGARWAPHWSVTSNLEQVRSEQAQSMTTNSKQSEQIRTYLEDRSAEIRRRMAKKYGDDFVKWIL